MFSWLCVRHFSWTFRVFAGCVGISWSRQDSTKSCCFTTRKTMCCYCVLLLQYVKWKHQKQKCKDFFWTDTKRYQANSSKCLQTLMLSPSCVTFFHWQYHQSSRDCIRLSEALHPNVQPVMSVKFSRRLVRQQSCLLSVLLLCCYQCIIMCVHVSWDKAAVYIRSIFCLHPEVLMESLMVSFQPCYSRLTNTSAAMRLVVMQIITRRRTGAPSIKAMVSSTFRMHWLALRNFKSHLQFTLIQPTFKPHFLASVPRPAVV